MRTSNPDKAWKSYVLAIVFAVPAFLVWFFADFFLSTTFNTVWENSHLSGFRPQRLMDCADFFLLYGRLILLVLVLIFLFLEYRVPKWPQYRRAVLMTVAFIFNTIVLMGMAFFSTWGILAAKLLLAERR